MKKVITSAALLSIAYALPASAQSAVTIYGILDEGIQYSNVTSRGSLTQMLPIAHVPSRIGFLGKENLGGDLSAVFRLEQGLALDTGNQVGNRLYGRASYVGLHSKSLGEVRFGRDYSLMQLAFGRYDLDHLSPYSPALAAQQSNLDQGSQDNMIKYISPTWNGFTGSATFALGERAAVVPAAGPQISGAGIARNSYGAMLEYDSGPVTGAIAYQTGGQSFNAGGDANQRLFVATAVYRFPVVEVGGMFWQQRNALSNGRTPVTNLWMLAAVWKVLPALELVGQVGWAQDNGMTYSSGAAKAKGTNTWLNVGATYRFSKRTAIYTRLGRITDENGGFNGRPALAAPSVQASPVPTGGSARAIMVGLRERF